MKGNSPMDLSVSHTKFAERLDRQADDGHGWNKVPDMLKEAAFRIRLLNQEIVSKPHAKEWHELHDQIAQLEAAAKWLISEAYWFQCEGGWDDPEGHGDVRPEAIRPTIESLCKEMWPKPLLPSVKAEATVPRVTDSASSCPEGPK